MRELFVRSSMVSNEEANTHEHGNSRAYRYLSGDCAYRPVDEGNEALGLLAQ